MWRSEILLQDLESYRGVSDSYNLRSRSTRQKRKQKVGMKLEKQKVGMKLEWPLESQHAFTRSKLKESQLTVHICDTWKVSQYLETAHCLSCICRFECQGNLEEDGSTSVDYVLEFTKIHTKQTRLSI